jgi:glucose-6-phosphate 1-dehydrogenase
MENQSNGTQKPLEVSEFCMVEKPPDPCSIVIFGASGDLTSRKIIPALYSLFSHHILPQGSRIIGCARTYMNTDQFREKMKKAIK